MLHLHVSTRVPLIRFSVIAVVSWVVLASAFQGAAAFDGNRRGFVLGCGAGVGTLADEDRWGLQSNLKLGWGMSDRTLLYYSGSAFVVRGGVLFEPTAAFSYYFGSRTPAAYLTGGLGITLSGSVLGEELGPHLSAGIGYEVFRHWSVELTAFGIYFEPGWSMNYALTVNVLGF